MQNLIAIKNKVAEGHLQWQTKMYPLEAKSSIQGEHNAEPKGY